MNKSDAKLFHININGNEYEAKKGQSILQVASENGINIPTLCYLEDIFRRVARRCPMEWSYKLIRKN